MSEPLGRALLPPRPNLGPESWPDRAPVDWRWLVMIGIVGSILAGWAFWKLARRRLARSRERLNNPEQVDPTPRGRLVALSMLTKNALATRFGSTWRAKTTEELAVEPLLVQQLGPESLEELITFLDRIDRLKFAPERANHGRRSLEEDLANWSPRIAGVISKIEARGNGRQK